MEEEACASSDLSSLPWVHPSGAFVISEEGNPMNPLLGVIRTVTIPTYLFDHLKDCQRYYERLEGRKLTNSQTLAILLQQHRDLLWPAIEKLAGA